MARSVDEIAVQAWARDVAARFDSVGHTVEVVYGDQVRSARPALPYITVLKLGERFLGEGETVYVESLTGDAVEEVTSYFESNFSVIVYGENHNQIARALVLSMRSDVITDANLARGLTLVDVVNGPLRLSTSTNGVTEDRTQFDVRGRYQDIFATENIPVIENLELTQA